MPPKTATKPKPTGSSFKALDDFLEKSSSVPGEVIGTQAQEQMDAHSKQITNVNLLIQHSNLMNKIVMRSTSSSIQR